jgi:hypothetical protein
MYFFLRFATTGFMLWSRMAHGTIGVAQCHLLAVFWAISNLSWPKRTLLFAIGCAAFIPSFAAIQYSLNKGPGLDPETLILSYTRTVQQFGATTLVVALLIDCLRPIWGTLCRVEVSSKERLTIFSLMRSTAMFALAFFIMSFSMEYDNPTTILILWNWAADLARALLLASCVWMFFGRQYQWIAVATYCVAIIACVCLYASGVDKPRPSLERDCLESDLYVLGCINHLHRPMCGLSAAG